MEKLTKWVEESLEKLKEKTKLYDAIPLIEECIKLSKKSDDIEEKKEFRKTLKESFESSGNSCLMRAFIEDIMTEEFCFF